MDAMIIQPKDKEQWKVVAGIMKALKIPFEKKEVEEESPYDPEFVADIKKADKEFKRGKGYKMTMDELGDF